MADASTKEATTNTTPKSYVDVTCDCNTMWSLAQQFSTKRLSVETGEHSGELIRDYGVRARRIAATYARFYLELDGGDSKKKGRYYWMALGAFASKTVACTFEVLQVKMMTLFTRTVWEGLGKGNFWLFCDISGWHWYHCNHPTSFDQCVRKRNASRYADPIRQDMEFLPWKKQALSTIGNFSACDQIVRGFELVKEIENSVTSQQRQSKQFDHLMAIAEHEQGVILQPLIYDDPAFAYWVQQQRATYAHWASPALELVFAHTCTTERLQLKSVAPEATALENYASRMTWIAKAANKFHVLMIKQSAFMESELLTIASWVDLLDVQAMQHSNAI